MNITLPATEQWDAVYYPNPIPLSSRSLLSFALLFDRLHIPGVSIPQLSASVNENDAMKLRNWVPADPEQAAYQNLCLWAIELPKLADFVHLPDVTVSGAFSPSLHDHALQLLDDTYGAGVSRAVTMLTASQTVDLPGTSKAGFALTWPLYQVRALQYAAECKLPLVSDDPACIPPLPPHPENRTDVKGLAQQLAVQALSMVLPPFRSVEPDQIAQFRDELQPLVTPFRREMVKMTADISAALTSGMNEQDLKQACKRLAESRVLPAMQDLSKQLKDPVKPFHKVVIDVAEASLATASSSVAVELAVGWVILRGAKIASEYAQLYVDREGKRKSGLSFLLKVRDRYASSSRSVSEWDKRDWRCSGSVDIPEPGFPLTEENQKLWAGPVAQGWKIATIRRLFQTRTMSFVKSAPPAYKGPWPV